MVFKEKILFFVVVVCGFYEILIVIFWILLVDFKKNVMFVGKICWEVVIVMFFFELNDCRFLKFNVNVILVIVFNIFNSYFFGEFNKWFMNLGVKCDICLIFCILMFIEISLICFVIIWRFKLCNIYVR